MNLHSNETLENIASKKAAIAMPWDELCKAAQIYVLQKSWESWGRIWNERYELSELEAFINQAKNWKEVAVSSKLYAKKHNIAHILSKDSDSEVGRSTVFGLMEKWKQSFPQHWKAICAQKDLEGDWRMLRRILYKQYYADAFRLNNFVNPPKQLVSLIYQDIQDLDMLVFKNVGLQNLKMLHLVNQGLWHLDIRENKVKDITMLKLHPNIKKLNLSYNKLDSLEGVECLKSLEEISFVGNKISDLSPLMNLPKLKRIYAGRNPLTTLEDLIGLPSLKVLNISNTKIDKVHALEFIKSKPNIILTHQSDWFAKLFYR